MFQVERILIPIDFSMVNSNAVRYTGILARHFGSQVTLFHVNEISVLHALDGPLGFGIASRGEEVSHCVAAQQQRLDEMAAAELSDVNVSRQVCSGDPARLIIEKACAEQSGLIIMTTHGGGRFRQYLLGSVTAKVLHDADCPVWTCAHLPHPHAASSAGIHHVMCAIDFGPKSADVIRWAAGFATAMSARLTMVHAVLETPPNLPQRYMFQWRDQAHRGSAERLRTLMLDSNVDADVLVVSDGDIPRALSTTAKEKEADLLIIGRSCAGDKQKRLGSHTFAIICNAACAVVSI